MKDRQGFFRIALHHSDEDSASFFYSKDSAASEKSYTLVGYFLQDLSEMSYNAISPFPLIRSVAITVMCPR